MEPFPANHELLGLLGEPILTDEGVPCAYNQLAFNQSVANCSIEVVVEPGYSHVEIRLAEANAEFMYLDLTGVAGLRVEEERGRADLIVIFGDRSDAGQLRLQVRPELHVRWAVGPDR